MIYHTNNKYRKYVQGYGFLSFAKRFGNKYSKKIVNKGITAATRFNKSKHGKALKKGLKFAKTSGKQILKRTAEFTVNLIGNKIAYEISSLNNKPQEQPEEIQEQQKIIIPPERRQKIIDYYCFKHII